MQLRTAFLERGALLGPPSAQFVSNHAQLVHDFISVERPVEPTFRFLAKGLAVVLSRLVEQVPEIRCHPYADGAAMARLGLKISRAPASAFGKCCECPDYFLSHSAPFDDHLSSD